MNTLGEKLKEKRERLGWTQAEAAKRAGIAESTVNRIERGKRMPHIANLKKIVEALGLEMSEILS